MIWNEENISEISEKLKGLIHLAEIEYYFEPAPQYIFGPNWNDELRYKNGYEMIDGLWQKRINVKDYWSSICNDISSLLKDKNRLIKENNLLKSKNYEMEYGLRVAGKALEKSLAITKEMIDE